MSMEASTSWTIPMSVTRRFDAIDAADDTVCSSTDQRGVTRPQGAGCDVGAVEVD